MNKTFNVRPMIYGSAAALGVLLSGCADMSNNEATGGSGASIGPITGFGSVYVNGVRFETNGDVNSNDGVLKEADLDKGMLLAVEGNWHADGEGQAQALYYDDTLRGYLEADATWDDVSKTGSLVVLKQTIKLDSQTVFGGTLTVDQLLKDSHVRISGWRLDDGTFRASYVGNLEFGDYGDNEFEVEGVITELDTDLQQFKIGGLTIRYNSLTEFDDMDESDLRNDLVVEVEGRSYSSGELLATEIEKESKRYKRFAGGDIEFSGTISGDYNETLRQFTLNGLLVQVDDRTDFDDGLRESDLQAGLMIQVEGEFNENGVVLAEEIEPREANAEVEAIVESIDFEANQMVVGGVRVQITSLTMLIDDNDDRMRFEDFRVGDFIEVEGLETTDSQGTLMVAIKIDRDDDVDDEFELEGRVTATDGSSFIEVLGVRLDIDFNTEVDGDVRIGSLVEVEYKRVGGQYLALEIELED